MNQLRKIPMFLLLVQLLVSCGNSDLLIKNATLVSPERTSAISNIDVLVRDGRIIALGDDLAQPSGATVLAADGLYLTPGLIDSHVHIYHATGLRENYTDNYAGLYDAYMAQLPRSYLYFGYTTLIELNADLETNRRFQANTPAPDLLHCGTGVILPDGFMAMDLPAGSLLGDYSNYLHDVFGSGYLPPEAVPDRHTPERVVDHVVGQGGICVKLYYEEAMWMPAEDRHFSLPSREILQAVDSVANARGMTTLLHATTPDGHRIGLEAGIDVMAHGLFEWPEVSFYSEEMPGGVAEILELQADNGILVQPTMQTLRNTASLFDPASLDDPILARVLPADYIHYLQTDAQVQRDLFMDMFGAAIDPDADVEEMADHQQAFNRRYEGAIGKLAREGGRLLFGTDTAVGGFGWGNPPGLNAYREMRGWQRAGIDLPTIFRAATLSNAEAFGLADELGTVEPGKQADLLLLRSNPLESLEAYNAIEYVIIDGIPFSRDKFDASPP